MLLAEEIQQRVLRLPNNLQAEVIDFIDFIDFIYFIENKYQIINAKKNDNFLEQLIQNPREVSSFKTYSREEIYNDR